MKNSLIYIFGEIVAKAIPFLLIPYLTRSLSVDGFGVLSFYLSIIPFLALLLGLNQWQALARYYHRYGQRAINLIVVSGHIYTLLFSVLIAGGLYFFLGLEKQFYLILACAVLQNIFTMHMALLQMDRQSILYALLQIVTGLFSVVITLLVFEYSGKTPENRLLSMALSSLIVVLLSTALFFYRNNRKVFFCSRQYKIGVTYVVSFGLPLFLTGIIYLTKSQLDKIVIFNLYTEKDLGIYSVAYQLSTIALVVIAGLNTALTPVLFEKLKQKTMSNRDLLALVKWCMIIVPLPSMIVAFVFPETLLTYIIGGAFSGIKYYLILFLVVAMLELPYLLLMNYLVYFNKGKLVSYATIVTTIIYFVVLFIVSRIGIEYIPFANILASVVLIAILYFYVYKEKVTE